MAENTKNQSNLVMKLKDYFLTQEEFELIKNPDFGFLETFPVPKNLPKYYESEHYISHTDANKSLFEKFYNRIKEYNIRYKFSTLMGVRPHQSLLEIGCGTGDFLRYAKDKNLFVCGTEPNQKARDIANSKLGENAVSDLTISEIEQRFDYITLWHVLEHIPDLNRTIIEIKHKLKPHGKLYVAVPNHQSFDAKFYKNHWAGYDVPRHLWHFSADSLEKLFNSFGMKIEKKYPMWFDSYYVSWLSEKYRNSNFGFLKALLIGTISNFVGLFNGNPSSIIYQITKN